MRPDSITPQYTPTLYELATCGPFFINHHSSYISTTEVNGAALATGMLPEHNGIMAVAKFTADRQFQNAEPGDILVINLGGSASFYVFEHAEAVTRRLISFLQTTDFAGVIFSALPVEGTFPLAQAHLNVTNGAPDVVVSMRWTSERSELGVPGMMTSLDGKKGRGPHGSLSPFDLHNTLVAAGPDFKKAFVDELPLDFDEGNGECLLKQTARSRPDRLRDTTLVR